MAQAALTTPLVGLLTYRDLCAQTVDVASTIRFSILSLVPRCLCIMAQAALTTLLVGPLSYRDLCAQTVDVASTIRWCQSLKLLRSNLMCSCGRGMNLVEREKAGKEGVLWR